MRPPSVLLLNPDSPRGVEVNREGMGGLGVIVPAGGFVYPALLLAELQGALIAAGCSVTALDRTLQPERRVAAPHDIVVVRAALASLEHDLAVAQHLAQGAGDARFFLLGTALQSQAAQIARRLPRATLLQAASGADAAALILDCPPPHPEDAADSDWNGLALGPLRWLPLHHQRGCSHACAWCPYTLATGRRLTGRSPARTAREFGAQVRKHTPRRVVFRDPLFAAEETDALLLLSRIAALPSSERAPFEVETRPEQITPTVAGALARAGCIEVKLGIDTLETEVLQSQGRLAPGRTAADYRHSVRTALDLLDRAGVAVRGYLLRGLPGATERGEADAAAAFADRPDMIVKQFADPATLMMARS